MLRYILRLSIPIIICVSLFSCGVQSIADSNIAVIATDISESESSALENNKISIDDIIFLGESTTYHLKSRGVLSGGKETTQVWGPKSGTLMLDTTINDCRIIYPEDNLEMSLGEALKRKQPKIMLLTFGLNGAANFITRGESYFKFCYQKLIDEIKTNSQNTEIIINSCFPIAQNMDMSRYTVDARGLNLYIDNINLWAQNLARENNLRYTDSASVLKDAEGFLTPELQAEDGYHLNERAYELILKYLDNELKNKEN